MRPAASWACLLALLLALVAPSHQYRDAPGSSLPAAAIGRRLAVPVPGRLLPTLTKFADHDLYYLKPDSPRGLVIILHKCGRTATDYFPWSREEVCHNCMGLPNALAKTKQVLARGYVAAAMSSRDRNRETRCFEWSRDADAVAQAVQQLPGMLGLPPGAPVYLDGVSSGGSVALRLPSRYNITVAGVIGEVIGPSDLPAQLDEMASWGRKMPPCLYIDMPKDTGMAPKVAANIVALKAHGSAVAEIQVFPKQVTEFYFSDCSPKLSAALSSRLVAVLHKDGLLDDAGWITVDMKDPKWNSFKQYVDGPGLQADLEAVKATQTVSFVPMLSPHIFECLGVAWACHETIGEYMTAALIWLESNGTADINALAAQYRMPRLTEL